VKTTNRTETAARTETRLIYCSEQVFVEFAAVEVAGFGSRDLVGPEVTAEVGFAIEGLSTYATIHHFFSDFLHISDLHSFIGKVEGRPQPTPRH